MGLTLELPQELASALSDEATRRGLSLSDYAVSVLTESQVPMAIQSGADLVAYWQREGVSGSRTDISDSQEHARKLREQAQNRG